MKILPIFNMKGGVAKTTTAVMLAEAFAEFCHANVLLIDCDPQFNATRMVVGTRQIDELFASPNNKARTIARYLQNCISQTALPAPGEYITKGVGTVFGSGRVDLLAGSPRTVDVDQGMMMAAAAPGRTIDSILERTRTAAIHLNKGGPYDLAIVDCPAAPSMCVRGFLRAADLLLVPTTADDSALAGLGTLDWNLKRFDERSASLIKARRVVVTRYKNFSQRNLDALSGQQLLALPISDAPQIRDARLFSSAAGATFQQKYGKSVERDHKKIANQLAIILGIGIASPAQLNTHQPKDVISVKRPGNGTSISSGTPGNHQRKASLGNPIGKGD